MNSNIPSILQKIVETKKEEIKPLISRKNQLISQVYDLPGSPLDFKKAIFNKKNKYTIISEVKKASPSAGIIERNFEPKEVAIQYQLGGADAISVLTDIQYFKGNLEYLKQVKATVKIPVLRKDFIISEEQIYESRIAGADSFLLIAAILDEYQLADFLLLGRELGMEPLIEIHNLPELEKVLTINSSIVGINNRNLNNFNVDVKTSLELIKKIPDDKVIVSESGIVSVEIAHKLYKAGCSSLLIGEFLMRSQNKPELIGKIKSCQ